MANWIIPKTGKISFELLKDFKEHNDTIIDLLKSMINGIATRALEYYYLTNANDQVFINSEGELHSSEPHQSGHCNRRSPG